MACKYTNAKGKYFLFWILFFVFLVISHKPKAISICVTKPIQRIVVNFASCERFTELCYYVFFFFSQSREGAMKRFNHPKANSVCVTNPIQRKYINFASLRLGEKSIPKLRDKNQQSKINTRELYSNWRSNQSRNFGTKIKYPKSLIPNRQSNCS